MGDQILDVRDSTNPSTPRWLHPEEWSSANRWIVAFIPPAAVLLFEVAFFDWIAPHTWFLFFPALFLSAWLSGLRPAIAASASTTAAAWWSLVQPRYTLRGDTNQVLAAVTLMITSSVMAVVVDRLRRSYERLANSSRDSQELERTLRTSLVDLERAQAVAKVGSWHFVEGDAFDGTDETNHILGTAPGTLIRYPEFLALVHPGDRAYVDEAWHAAVARERPYDIEFRLVVHGELKWVRAKADLGFDDKGALVSTIGILQDITVRKNLEEQLHRAGERMELALKGANLAVWDWTVQTGAFVHDARWAEIRGYERGEGETHVEAWFGGIHPDDMPRWQQKLFEVFEGRCADYEVDLRVATRDKRWIWILQRGKVIARDERGWPIRITGTSLDITQRKRWEMEQRFLADLGPRLDESLVVEDTIAAVAELAVRDLADWCVIDLVEDNGEVRRAKIASANPSKQSLADEFARLPLDRARPLMVTQVLNTGISVLDERVKPETLEIWAQTPEHLRLLREADICSILWVALQGRERILGALGLVSSAPSRRYDRADLRFAEELARRASLSLENARLYRAAERAIAARDEVLAVVAHDLRNPLGTILIHAQKLRRSATDPDRPASQTSEPIERAARRMDRLIQDLLDVTRAEAGQLTLDRSTLSAWVVASEAVEAQKPLATAASIELRLVVTEDQPHVFADHHRLLQVFENLIGNAMKFTPAGGRITVGSVAHNGSVLYYVRDTGPGVSIEDQGRLFDRFWQANRNRAGNRGDSGLGLPIVKGIVEAHGGRVWVESAPGEGCTFYFTIPTVRSLDIERQPSAPPQS